MLVVVLNRSIRNDRANTALCIIPLPAESTGWALPYLRSALTAGFMGFLLLQLVVSLSCCRRNQAWASTR